jgi:hypothetical protein
MCAQVAHLEASLNVPHTYDAVAGDEDMEGRMLERLAELETRDSISISPQGAHCARKIYHSANFAPPLSAQSKHPSMGVRQARRRRNQGMVSEGQE